MEAHHRCHPRLLPGWRHGAGAGFRYPCGGGERHGRGVRGGEGGAVRAIKESAYRSLDLPLEHALRMNTLLSRINRDTEDSMEGPHAFVEKRPPVYKAR